MVSNISDHDEKWKDQWIGVMTSIWDLEFMFLFIEMKQFILKKKAFYYNLWKYNHTKNL